MTNARIAEVRAATWWSTSFCAITGSTRGLVVAPVVMALEVTMTAYRAQIINRS